MGFLDARIEKNGDREYLDMGRSVNFLPVFKADGKFYCLAGMQLPKPGRKANWYCLGGYVESTDEHYLDTAMRELEEETNLSKGDILYQIMVYKDMEIASGYSNESNTMYIIKCHAEAVSSIRSNDVDENSRFALINIDLIDFDEVKDKQLYDALKFYSENRDLL